MKTETEITAWVDDAQDINFRYPGADVTPSIFVSIDGDSRGESYENLFVCGDLGAITDIPALMRTGDLQDLVWKKIQELEAELLDALTTAQRVAAEMGQDGSRFTGYNGVDLDEICDRLGGGLIEVHANQRRYQFADGSGVIISEDSWDLAVDPRCWCRMDDGHDPENCEIPNEEGNK